MAETQKYISPYIHAVIIAASFLLMYYGIITELIADWSSNDNYSHGFLVPFISAYMVWQQKNSLIKCIFLPDNRGLFLIVAGLSLYVLGTIGAEFFLMRFSIIVLIAGIVLYLLGKEVFREVSIPILYLIFMIPIPAIIWNKIAFPLQLFAAGLTAETVTTIGIPILREGNVLHLANTSLEVVDACSGLRSLTSLLALGGAFAYMCNLKAVNKWIVFFSAVPIAVLVNIIRLTATAMMAHWIGAEAAQGFLHDMSGILVFVIAFFSLFGVYLLMVKIEKRFVEKADVPDES